MFFKKKYIPLKSGGKIKVKDFTPRVGNTITIMIKWANEISEVAFVTLPDEFVDDYVKDRVDSEPNHYGMLKENVPRIFKKNVYGLVLPIRLNGKNRPVCDLSLIDWVKWKKIGGPFFNLKHIK